MPDNNNVKKFLDLTGLSALWTVISNRFSALEGSTLTNVEYYTDTTDPSAPVKKLRKTVNGTSTDIVSVPTLKQDLQLTPSDVQLGNVDNTADLDKPVSTATQTALDAKANVNATVSAVDFDSSTGAIQQTINGTTSEVVRVVTKQEFDTLVGSGNATGAIDTFNEITAFLANYSATDTTLQGVIDALASQYVAINDLQPITAAEIQTICV